MIRRGAVVPRPLYFNLGNPPLLLLPRRPQFQMRNYPFFGINGRPMYRVRSSIGQHGNGIANRFSATHFPGSPRNRRHQTPPSSLLAFAFSSNRVCLSIPRDLLIAARTKDIPFRKRRAMFCPSCREIFRLRRDFSCQICSLYQAKGRSFNFSLGSLIGHKNFISCSNLFHVSVSAEN